MLRLATSVSGGELKNTGIELYQASHYFLFPGSFDAISIEFCCAWAIGLLLLHKTSPSRMDEFWRVHTSVRIHTEKYPSVACAQIAERIDPSQMDMGADISLTEKNS